MKNAVVIAALVVAFVAMVHAGDGGPCDGTCNAPECECSKSCGNKCACNEGLPEGATCCANIQCNNNKKCVGGKCGGASGLFAPK